MDTMDTEGESTQDDVVESSEGQEDSTTFAPDQSEETSESPRQQRTESLDPLKLVDNLDLPQEQKKAIRDSLLMQSDYTRKTQEIADVKKQWEQWQPIVNYLSENPGVLENLVAPQEEELQDEEIPDDPREFYNSILSRAKTEAVQEAITQMEQKQNRQYDIQTAASLDPRLTDDSFGRIIASLVEADPDVKAGRKSYTDATQTAIGFYDSYAKGMESKVRQDITHRAQSKSMVTPQRSSPMTTQQGAPKTMRDAYKQTLDELGI